MNSTEHPDDANGTSPDEADLPAAQDETPIAEVDVPTAEPETPTPPADTKAATGPTRISGVWVGLVIAAIVMVFLLIFILQNQESVEIDFLGLTGHLPLGVALLLAAISGLLIVAVPGGARIFQLRRKLRSRD